MNKTALLTVIEQLQRQIAEIPAAPTYTTVTIKMPQETYHKVVAYCYQNKCSTPSFVGTILKKTLDALEKEHHTPLIATPKMIEHQKGRRNATRRFSKKTLETELAKLALVLNNSDLWDE
jgi:hypothetical protein